MWLVLGVSACGPHSLFFLCSVRHKKTAPKNVQDCCEQNKKSRKTLQQPTQKQAQITQQTNNQPTQQTTSQPTDQRTSNRSLFMLTPVVSFYNVFFFPGFIFFFFILFLYYCIVRVFFYLSWQKRLLLLLFQHALHLLAKETAAYVSIFAFAFLYDTVLVPFGFIPQNWTILSPSLFFSHSTSLFFVPSFGEYTEQPLMRRYIKILPSRGRDRVQVRFRFRVQVN